MKHYLFMLLVSSSLLSIGGPAFADWKINEDGTEFSEGEPVAFGTANSVGVSVGVFCKGNQPQFFVWGHPTYGGSEETVEIDINVSGSSFVVSASQFPPDGIWMGSADPDLIEALRYGTILQVLEEIVSLGGSRSSIDAALDMC